MKETKVFDREDQARAWAKGVEKRMKAGTWSPPIKGEDKRYERTFKDAAEAYLESPAFLSKKDTTRHSERHKLTPAIEGLGSRVLNQITVVDVENHLARRALVQPKRAQWAAERAKANNVDVPPEVAERKLSKDQRRLELAAISAVFNYAKDQKWVDDNPTWHVKRPGSTERTGRIDELQMGKLMEFFISMDTGTDEADLRPYWFFSLLFSCLARPGELAGARREWLRNDPPQIVLPGIRSKNSDARVIVVPQSLYSGLLEYLEKQPDDCPYVFGTRRRDKKGWSPYNYSVPWSKARKALGLEGLVPHLARHEGISRLFERTELSDGQIASLSGHRTPQALWRYKHLRNELQRDKIEDLYQDVFDSANRSVAGSHPSRHLKPGERLGENRPAKKRANPR